MGKSYQDKPNGNKEETMCELWVNYEEGQDLESYCLVASFPHNLSLEQINSMENKDGGVLIKKGMRYKLVNKLGISSNGKVLGFYYKEDVFKMVEPYFDLSINNQIQPKFGG